MENNSISVIMPLKSRSVVEFDEFFEKSIQSINNQKDYVDEVVIVYCDDTSLEVYLKEFDFKELNVVLEKWTDTPNFANQVNHGVKISKSNWCF